MQTRNTSIESPWEGTACEKSPGNLTNVIHARQKLIDPNTKSSPNGGADGFNVESWAGAMLVLVK